MTTTTTTSAAQRWGDSGWRLVLRICWIVTMLAAAYIFGDSGERFFYQGF
jgi:hypothetical protein